MTTTELGIYNIVVITDIDGGGTITSDLHDGGGDDDDDGYDAAIDVVEWMILAHACAGVDVTTEPYVSGVTTIVESIANAYA